jgi:hypothetical protein
MPLPLIMLPTPFIPSSFNRLLQYPSQSEVQIALVLTFFLF